MEKEMNQHSASWEVIFSDADCTQIWKYDKKKFANGPVSVETKWEPHIIKEWTKGKKIKSVRKTK